MVLFQNCSPASTKTAPPSNNNGSGTGDPTPTPNPNPTNNSFTAGDAVSSQNIPTDKSYMLNNLSNYLAASGFKAIAIAQNGYGYLMYGDSDAPSENQTIASVRAMEACQIASDNNACSLFAEGNTVKYDEADFNQNFQKFIDLSVSTYSADNVPFVNEAIYTNTLPGYTNGGTNKALALTIDGGGGYRVGAPTADEAEADAMNQCEQANPGFCLLYSINDQVVLDQAAITSFFNANFKE